jgi:hypothetical protein
MAPAPRQLARVAVDDETWRRFRQVAVVRDISIAAYLGRLVERELRRRADRPIADVAPDQPSRDHALLALAEVRQAIDELDDLAGRLARTAVAHGASWRDVGSSRRLSSAVASQAFRRSA